jgi:hypothetical protein
MYIFIYVCIYVYRERKRHLQEIDIKSKSYISQDTCNDIGSVLQAESQITQLGNMLANLSTSWT